MSNNEDYISNLNRRQKFPYNNIHIFKASEVYKEKSVKLFQVDIDLESGEAIFDFAGTGFEGRIDTSKNYKKSIFTQTG